MLEEFKTYIQNQHLFKEGDKILLAVSGGIDSIVMMHLFHEAKIGFGIAHCNFKLRGKDSDADEQFVKKYAKELHASFYAQKFNTKKIAQEKLISIQMAARDLRYEFFEEIRAKHKFDFIAIAHNADDSAETVLLNLLRGTGIAGYHGIPATNKKVIRPLLFASRQEIIKYAKREKIKWREDKSNASDEYIRNKIRLKIIPRLKKINPSILQSLTDHIFRMSETESLYQEYIQRLKEELILKKGKEIYIDIAALRQHTSISTLLFELLKNYGFNNDTVKEITNSLNTQPGKRFFSSTHQLVKDREYFILSEKSKTEKELLEITSEQHELSWKKNNLCIRKITLTSDLKEKILLGKISDRQIAYFDETKIKFPLRICKWEKGDFFYPLGMRNKKRLSDYFIDQKISVTEKQKMWLLKSENDIIWIMGERTDDRYKIRNESHNCLQLTFARG